MKRYLIFSVIVISLMVPSLSRSEEFTQKDRERLIRLETKVEEGQKALQRRITDLSSTMQRQTSDLKTSMQRQIADLRAFLLWGFGLLFTGMLILVGFILWDRRSTLKPVKDELDKLERRKVDRLLEAMRKLSEEDSRVAQVLRSVGLL